MGLVAVAGVALGVGGYLIRGRTPAVADPLPLYSHLWESKTQQFESLDRAHPGPAIVYLGDSTCDWINLDEYWTCTLGRVLNRGISGDTTAGVLDRLNRSFPSTAAVCFVTVGYNDLAAGASPQDVAGRVVEISRVLRDHHGVRHVVLESLLSQGRLQSSVRSLNNLLAHRCLAEPGVAFLDLQNGFNGDGQDRSSLLVDDVHLSGLGVRRRIEIEAAYLRSIMPDLAVDCRLSHE